jgi:hypothetical protein
VITIEAGELIEQLKRLNPRDKVAVEVIDADGDTVAVAIEKVTPCGSSYGYNAVLEIGAIK